jgi:hypothetical protein
VTTPPFPFFVGVGRSGTTLVRSIFSAHPQLAVADEPNFIVWMLHHRSRYANASVFDTERFLYDLLENPKVPSRVYEWRLDDRIRSSIREAGPRDLSHAVRLVYAVYSEADEKERYGDKTPGHAKHMAALAELLPEARFVHIVRDGRDVALALKDVKFGSANATQAAYHWARRVRRAAQIGHELGSARYLKVRYEDLTTATEAEVRRICDFLALEFEPAMLRYFERPDAVFAGLTGEAHHQRLRLPVTKGLRDWRQQMAPREIQRFEAIAGDVLRDLGYELSTGGAPSMRVRGLSGLLILKGRLISAWRRRSRRRVRRRGRRKAARCSGPLRGKSVAL